MNAAPAIRPIRRRAAIALVAGLALTGAFFAPTSPAGAANCPGDIQGWQTACDPGQTSAVITGVFTLNGWQTLNDYTISCTDAIVGSALDDTHTAPDRSIPAGVEVSEPGGIGVSAGSATSDYDARFQAAVGSSVTDYGVYELGPRELSMTNWSLKSQTVTIRIFCTTDKGRWHNVLDD